MLFGKSTFVLVLPEEHYALYFYPLDANIRSLSPMFNVSSLLPR